jgi:signal transduction histidine kinase
VNNALNGAVVNLEVVRLRARPGTDGAAAAPFAETAAGELERSAAMVAALVALTRAPRAGGVTDVRELVRQVTELLTPSAAQRGLTVALDAGSGGMGTDAPPIGVRLGVVAAFLAALDLAEVSPADELAGKDPAVEPARLLRCTLRLDPGPLLRIDGPDGPSRVPTSLDVETVAVLSAAGLDLSADAEGLVLRCPPA